MLDHNDGQAQALSLLQFCSAFRQVVEESQMAAWVCAEVGQVSCSRGHYYVELVQKSEFSDQPVAKLRCTIWASTANVILANFQQITGSDLQQGMRVLVFISLFFHEVWGLSGSILAIDPSFTIGELEARRKAILDQIVKDGVADMNKQFVLPLVIQRVAVISAESAAGYGDFCNQLQNNPYGIDFRTTLFPAAVQGADAERSLVAALEAVANSNDKFDVVVIIRGGGSRLDLACFDSYDLAINIAQFPLPVITGIGHERDHSIADFVAHTSVKTPTAVAEFLIGHNADFLADLQGLAHRVAMVASASLASARSRTQLLRQSLLMSVGARLAQAQQQADSLRARALQASAARMLSSVSSIESLEARLMVGAKVAVSMQNNRLAQLSMRLSALDPREVLRRGYSVTTDAEGRRVVSVEQVAAGQDVRTFLSDGHFDSSVK